MSVSCDFGNECQLLQAVNRWKFGPKSCSVFVTVHGFPVPSSPCLMCVRVWAGVCGCVWLRLIRFSCESSPWAILDPVTLSPFVRSLQCLPCSGRRFRSVPVPGSAIPEPCCFPGLRTPETRLPIASLRYPPLPMESSTIASLFLFISVINLLFSATESSRLHCDRRIWPIFMDSAETQGLQELLAGNNARMDLPEEIAMGGRATWGDWRC